MRKAFFVLLLPLLAVLLAACGGKSYDYTAHLSEIRSDIFRAESEEFSLTLTVGAREYPYASDGVACPLQNVAEISLTAKNGVSYDYEIYVTAGGAEWGGEMSYRNVKGDYYYSRGIEVFPEGQVEMRVAFDGQTREFVATSVKTPSTISPERALAVAVEHEKETVARLTQNGVFGGEFRVRLLRRDANYYYVGIVDPSGGTLSLLLDAETGEVLARRENP